MLIFRAILGGAIGGIAWLFLPAIVMGANLMALGWILVWYLIFGLWISAFIGAVIGFVIWYIHKRGEITLRMLPRAAVGVPVAFMAIAIYFFQQGSIADLTFWHVWYSLFFSIAVGVPSGLIAGRPPNHIGPAAQQIVGREQRERESHHDSSGDA